MIVDFVSVLRRFHLASNDVLNSFSECVWHLQAPTRLCAWQLTYIGGLTYIYGPSGGSSDLVVLPTSVCPSLHLSAVSWSLSLSLCLCLDSLVTLTRSVCLVFFVFLSVFIVLCSSLHTPFRYPNLICSSVKCSLLSLSSSSLISFPLMNLVSLFFLVRRSIWFVVHVFGFCSSSACSAYFVRAVWAQVSGESFRCTCLSCLPATCTCQFCLFPFHPVQP